MGISDPARRRATILRLSGLTMRSETVPIGPPAWTLRMVVPIRRVLYTSITSL